LHAGGREFEPLRLHMKKLLLIMMLAACTTQISSVNGIIEVDDDDILTKRMVVDSTQKPYKTETGFASCTYSGYCTACGLKIDGKFECGFGFYYSCNGHQYRKTLHSPYIFHYEYDTKTHGIISTVQYKTEDLRVIDSGPCN
jgi:hypothetical protein